MLRGAVASLLLLLGAHCRPSPLPPQEVLLFGKSDVHPSVAALGDCPRPNADLFNRNPATVRELSPLDIRTFMLIGDSASMGYMVQGDKKVNRGLSGVIGADKGAVTLPNILRMYHDNMTGTVNTVQGDYVRSLYQMVKYTHDKKRSEAAPAPYNESLWENLQLINTRGCDGAFLGAGVHDCPAQVRAIANCTDNFEDAWKMLTVNVGLADIASHICTNSTIDEPVFKTALEKLKEGYTVCLEMIRKYIPKVFVNLMTLPNMASASPHPPYNSVSMQQCMNKAEDNHRYYQQLQKLYVSLPGRSREMGWRFGRCIVGNTLDVNATEDDLAQLAFAGDELNAHLHSLARSYKEKDYDTFAAVVQPVVENMTITATNVSEFDCLHPDSKIHHQIAVGLWNSMVLPPDQKVKDCKSSGLCDVPGCLQDSDRLQI